MPKPISTFAACMICLCLMCTGMQGYAQEPIDKKVDRKVDQRVDREVDKKIDQTLDDAVQSIGNLFKKKKKVKTEDGEEVQISTEGDEIVIEDETGSEVRISYEADDAEIDPNVQPSSFIGSFTISFSESKNGKVKKDYPMSLEYFVDEYQLAFIPEDEDGEAGVMIWDRQRGTMTTKMDDDGQRIAMVIPMRGFQVTVDSKEVEQPEFNIEATGNTKEISGYLCKEYRYKSETEQGTIWMTEDFDLNWYDMFSFVGIKGQKKGNGMNSQFPVDGMMMEMRSEVPDKGIVREYKITDVSEGSVDKEIFSLDGYTVQSLGGSIFNSND
ncbi:DUF4412 domain-containing protein [Pontibacter sp. G13]|uniref:DUF4412 domain-containing protein n=1 Tax=Pontibacter sp. G13 TaxID=3074898 RepID=UPI00288AA590|nr:DUF4412 domain-containing protein [Pontibacter sp. G13]WNJ17718.1 DUF4412 domain-containing protein [Pontibacter sp. G13]